MRVVLTLEQLEVMMARITMMGSAQRPAMHQER